MDLIASVKQAHAQRFGAAPIVVAYAPGRVEILGNHTDYNEGFVLSAAIDLGIAMAASPAANPIGTLQALDIGEEAAFELPVSAPLKKKLWANYVAGVVAKLAQAGHPPKGFNATFSGTIPQGAGLSSSAALEVASALALGKLNNVRLPKLAVAKLCQAAENEFAGARCGLLDQISSLYGEPATLVFTDFRSLKIASVPLGDDVCFLVANTRAKHNLVESEYNDRRAQCEQATAFFAAALNHPVGALRDVSLEELKLCEPRMDPLIARRAAHIIEENHRVLEGRKFLAAGNPKGFGELMYRSHRSSRTNFENSCPELDFIVAQAGLLPRVLGARLSGGGFGGSVVLMVHPRDADSVGQALASAYAQKFGHPCEIRAIRSAAGARVL